MRRGVLSLSPVAGLLAALVLAAASSWGPAAHAQSPDEAGRPSIGYAYPAGGQAGQVVHVLVGGQNVRGVRGVEVTGTGVTAEIERWVRPLSFQQQRELRRRIAAIVAERRAAARPDRPKRRERTADKAKAADKPAEPEIELPSHPLLDNLESRTEREFLEIAARFIDDRSKKQINRQLAEVVEILVEVAPGTPPGWRELRLMTTSGLTNSVRFRVDALPEVLEREPLGQAGMGTPTVDVPVLLNGQILPGDVDTFRFRARGGARLRLTTAARDLVPFLADAVPGWFQAVVTVRDDAGHEIAFSDDFGFEPDPRLVLDIPADGEYEVEIRDSIYRGREDFVYRIAIEEDPHRAWTPSRDDVAPQTLPSSFTGYPEVAESEPNDDLHDAQGLLAHGVVRGVIAYPGDIDAFVFQGRAGEEIVVEIEARRAGSPLDAVIHVLGPSGDVIAWNDDFDDGAPGMWTHAADAYVRARLPDDGAYVVRVADVCGLGGAAYSYRLRVSAPRPDFQVVVTPSALRVAPGAAIPIEMHVVRRDGYDGPVSLHIPDAPPGFQLTGDGAPGGAAVSRLTLTAPLRPLPGVTHLTFVGRASIDGKEIVHDAVAADVRMQAFAYQHLVPAENFSVLVVGPRRAGAARVASVGRARLAPGRKTPVAISVPGVSERVVLVPVLDAPPAGVAIAGWEITAGQVTLFLTGTEDAEIPTANVIVQAWYQVPDGKGGTRRTFAGYLPAIGVEPLGATTE